MNSKALIILFSFTLFACYSFSQNLSFQSYSSAQGLTQNSIYSMAQTNDGFMWFGTQDGINRFDGRNFIAITPAMTNDITKEANFRRFSKMITALFADRDDQLWVGTTQEIALYNRYTNKFILPAVVYKGFSIPNGLWIKQITEDGNKNIWIVSQNDGMFCYSKILKAMVPVAWQGIKPDKIVTVSCVKDGSIWTSSENEIYKLEQKTFIPVGIKNRFPGRIAIVDMSVVNGQPWLINASGLIIILQPGGGNNYSLLDFSEAFKGKKYLSDPRLLHQSDSNTLWIGSRSEGLIKINLTTKTFENAEASGSVQSLKRQFILSLFTNRQNITWIGLSGGGIAKYDLQKMQFSIWRNEPEAHKPVPDNMLLSLFSQNDEDFYMGTLYGGLLHTNIKDGAYQYYLPPVNKHDESGSKNVYEIIAGENDLLWMATWSGLYSFNKQTKKFIQYTDENDEETKELFVVLKLKTQNKLLVGGYRGGLRLFNLDTRTWEHCPDPKMVLNNHELRVRYMKEVSDGIIYMSTEVQNLVRYNYHSGEFTFFPELLRISGISRYFCFDSSYLWVATDDGLIQVSASSMKVFKIWNTDNGLPNNYIYAVQSDSYDRIWVSSNGGLALLDHKTGVCKKFTEDDGLQSMEFNTASSYKDKEGKLWFGGINGLNMVNPSLSPRNEYSPVPLITVVTVMNSLHKSDTAIPYLRSMALPYSKNSISFEFVSPNFSQSENIIYEYMLSGVDTGWIRNGTRNYVSYTQLKPGHYTFRVRSANSNYVFSKNAAEIAIIIVPPWYKTWWFYATVILLVAALFFLFIRQRINNIRYKAEAKHQIVETQMAALKAQMNPHFMFNCINSIDSFIHSNDKYNATLYLNKFAKLLRNILDSSKQNTVPFTKDIETLKLYIELEELRNGNKFKTILEIDDDLTGSDYKVPPLIIQPFVENAILHGLKNKDGRDGLLKIVIKKSGDGIEYEITDNGVGRKAARQMPANSNASYGMPLSYDRIKLFNKEQEASVKVTDLYNNDAASGTVINVQLKITS